MREIKFRAWDKIKKRWIGISSLEHLCVDKGIVVLVQYAPNNQGGYSPCSCKQLTNPEVSNLEICQYTGLIDGNGKEIYEGDIVVWGYKKQSGKFAFQKIIKFRSDKLKCGYNINFGDNKAVIGNIYENKDLLK